MGNRLACARYKMASVWAIVPPDALHGAETFFCFPYSLGVTNMEILSQSVKRHEKKKKFVECSQPGLLIKQ